MIRDTSEKKKKNKEAVHVRERTRELDQVGRT